MGTDVINPYSTVQITLGQNNGVKLYKTVPFQNMILAVIWPFASSFGPNISSFQQLIVINCKL